MLDTLHAISHLATAGGGVSSSAKGSLLLMSYCSRILVLVRVRQVPIIPHLWENQRHVGREAT